MIRSIIVDDEPKLREVLKIKLNHNCPTVDVIGEASTVDEAYEKINLLKPNVVFLDIAMTGETGFDLLDRFSTINFEVIFVTGFNTYAMEAMQANAVDYILKPIKTDHLISAVQKGSKNIISTVFTNHTLSIKNISISITKTAHWFYPMELLFLWLVERKSNSSIKYSKF